MQPQAWAQVEGISVLANAANVTLAEEFVDWFTSYRAGSLSYQGQTFPASAQTAMPESQWMYPANKNAPIPAWSAFLPFVAADRSRCCAFTSLVPPCSYAQSGIVDPSSVSLLNARVPPAAIAANLPGWLHEWANIRATTTP